jgi:hypothetical protein
LEKAQEELAEAESDPTMPLNELELAQGKVQGLEEQVAKLLNKKSGKSRQIVEGDRGKARQRVRKALKLVTKSVARQHQSLGTALAEALGDGKSIIFRPPPDWGL